MYHVANRGFRGHAPPGNFDFGPFIKMQFNEIWDCFCTNIILPYIVSLKLLYLINM